MFPRPYESQAPKLGRPGNWLPLPANGAEFKLVLTLINADRKVIEDPSALKLPEIRLESCR